MARSTLSVHLDLERVHCHDEGDGWGSAEPYLWTVFFKVDGTSVSITSALNLSGTATVAFTPGSHGNLGDTDVDAGDDVPVPSALGRWDTSLEPIPVPPPFDSLADDVGGVIGVVCVLMEEDNVTDDGAEAGHAALNTAVRDAINQIVATRTLTNQDVSDEEIAAFEETIESAVSDAVRAQQSFFENLWSWLNPDDTIGFKAFTFGHDDLAETGTINFSHRWDNEGDWEIFGSVTAAAACPASALESLLETLFASDERTERNGEDGRAGIGLDRWREFRDGPYRELPGLAAWWRLAERNTAAFARVLLANRDLRARTRDVLRYVSEVVSDLSQPVDPRRLEDAATLMRDISVRTRSRRLRIDASRTADLMPAFEGKTLGDAARALATIRPARNPRVEQLGGVRIMRRKAAAV